MVLTRDTIRTQEPPHPQCEAILLRLHDATGKPRVVRITSPVCRIGADSGNTLRLIAPDVCGKHCTIRSTRGRTLVQSEAAASFLNGRQFQQAELRTGDRLRLGSVELDVLAVPRSLNPPWRDTIHPSRSRHAVGPARDDLAGSTRTRSRPRRLLSGGKAEWQPREDHRADDSPADRSVQAAGESLEKLSDLVDELARAGDLLRSEQQTLTCESRQRNASIDQLQQTLEQHSQQWSEQQQAVLRRHDALQQQLTHLLQAQPGGEERPAVEQLLAEVRLKLDACSEKLDKQESALQQWVQSQPDAEKSRQEQADDCERQRQSAIDARDAELAALHDSLAHSKQQLEQQQQDLERRSDMLREEAQSLRNQQAVLEDQQACWQRQYEAEQSRLDHARREVQQQQADCQEEYATQQHRLQQTETLLAEQRQQLEADRDQFAGETARQEKELRRRRIELEAAQDELADRQASLNRERQEQEETFARQRADHEKAAAELAQRRAGLDSEVAEFQKREALLASREGQVVTGEQALAEQQRQLEQAWQQLEQQREAFATEQAEPADDAQEHAPESERAEQRAKDEQRLEQEQTRLAQWEASLADEKQRLQADRAGLESQRPELQQQRETLQASQAELETAREQLAAQQADFESERARWQERRQQQEAALEQQQQEAAQQRAALEEQQAELSREQETLELELQQREADLQTREHSLLETQEHWEQQRAAEEAQLVASRRQLEQQQAALAEQEASWVQSQTGSAGTTATPPADQDRDQAPTAGTQHDAPAAGQSSREERPATWNAERSPASREDVPAKEVAVDATAEGTEQASPSEPFGDRSQAHTRSARERLFGRTQSETPSSLPASPAPDEAEAAFEPPESAAPSDEDDTMQRIRAMVSWMEDDEGEEGSQVESLAADEGVPGAIEDAVSLEDAADASSPHDSHEPSQGAAASGDDHEESIEAYMAQLLSRVQGRSELARPTPADSAKPVTQPVTSPPPAPVAKPSGEEDMQLVNPEPVRRSQPHRLPAELSSNLAAMRELANSTSRTAIDASIRNRWRQAATGKLAVGAIALVCGVILTILADSVFDLTFLGAGVSFVVATFWILQSAIIQRNIIRHSKDDADRTDAAPPDQRQSSHRHHEQSAETGKETAAEEPADS